MTDYRCTKMIYFITIFAIPMEIGPVPDAPKAKDRRQFWTPKPVLTNLRPYKEFVEPRAPRNLDFQKKQLMGRQNDGLMKILLDTMNRKYPSVSQHRIAQDFQQAQDIRAASPKRGAAVITAPVHARPKTITIKPSPPRALFF
eukprot:NODE_132_length_18298_cov_0.443101.p10 type:complete len:143 gc:universal NODE_132_length_18298_cov_0.443101:7881-8309(+)